MENQLSAQDWLAALINGPSAHFGSLINFDHIDFLPINSDLKSSEFVSGSFEAAVVKLAFEVHGLCDVDFWPWPPAQGWDEFDRILDQIPTSSLLRFLTTTQVFYRTFDWFYLPIFRELLSQNLFFGLIVELGLIGNPRVNFDDFELIGSEILAREQKRRQFIARADFVFNRRIRNLPSPLVRHFLGFLVSTDVGGENGGDQTTKISGSQWHYCRIRQKLIGVIQSKVPVFDQEDLVQETITPRVCEATKFIEKERRNGGSHLVAALQWLEQKRALEGGKTTTNQQDIVYWPHAISNKAKDQNRKTRVRSEAGGNRADEINSHLYSPVKSPADLTHEWPSKSREQMMIQELDRLIGPKRRQVFLIMLRAAFGGTEDLTNVALAEEIGMSPSSFCENKKKNQSDAETLKHIYYQYFF